MCNTLAEIYPRRSEEARRSPRLVVVRGVRDKGATTDERRVGVVESGILGTEDSQDERSTAEGFDAMAKGLGVKELRENMERGDKEGDCRSLDMCG